MQQEITMTKISLSPAQWISDPLHNGHTMQPVSCFAKEFTVQTDGTAELTLSALGIVRPEIDGEEITDELFLPGWTDYNFFAETRTLRFPVQSGKHLLTIELADGWYAGKIALECNNGNPPALIAVLDYPGGKLVTDEKWLCSFDGPLAYSDIYMGEKCIPGRTWQKFHTVKTVAGMPLEKFSGTPVRRIRKYPAVSRNKNIVDFGSNITGYATVKFTAPAGKEITIRYAETLDENRELYTVNLRTATATDICISPGGTFTYTPSFTFHGFRYIEVTGADDFEAEAVLIHSDMSFHSSFDSSNPLLNQLVKNVELSWRDNAFDIPTDCPQRDERRGWLGDAQIFCKSAMYLSDAEAFFRRWLKSVRASQREDGAFADLVPGPYWSIGQAGWADAGVSIPWDIYTFTGNKEVLKESFDAMMAWINYREKRISDNLPMEAKYGDWLNLDDPTGNELLGDAFHAHCVDLMAKICSVLEKKQKASELEKRFAALRQNFMFKYQDAMISQSACAIALNFDLLDGEFRQAAIDRLLKNILEERGGHLSTGFLGTPHLLHALTKAGRDDIAWQLLEETGYPSWLYQVKMGATTMWERWYSLTENGFASPNMNSFNHYAYGSVFDWIMGVAAGIKPDFSIDPHPGGSLKFLEAEYRGLKVRWEQLPQNRIRYQITVPENRTAFFRNRKLEHGQYDFTLDN